MFPVVKRCCDINHSALKHYSHYVWIPPIEWRRYHLEQIKAHNMMGSGEK